MLANYEGEGEIKKKHNMKKIIRFENTAVILCCTISHSLPYQSSNDLFLHYSWNIIIFDSYCDIEVDFLSLVSVSNLLSTFQIWSLLLL